MYERFTEQARKVMQLANQEAQRFHHEYIGSEHLLIGIINEGTSIGATVLKQFGIDLHSARTATQKRLRTEPEQTTGKLPQSPEAKNVLEQSMKHSRELNHNFVSTEHLLLALIGDQTGAAAVLRELNVDLEQTRADVLSRISDDAPTSLSPTEYLLSSAAGANAPFDYSQFTKRARKVIQLANQEAQRFNHELIDSKHLLLGLVKEGTGVGANVLKGLDIDLRKVRLEVEKRISPGPEMITMGKLPFTEEAKKIRARACEEARSLNHNSVGTEHLLLALIDEVTVARDVLILLGINPSDARQKVLGTITDKPAEPASELETTSESEKPSTGKRLSQEEAARMKAERKKQTKARRSSAPIPSGSTPENDNSRFTDRARKVFQLANQEAQRFHHEHVASEHLLLGLIKEQTGAGEYVFKNLNINLQSARREVEKRLASGPEMINMGKLPFTENMKRVRDRACDEARTLNHSFVDTEHLLLALVGESDTGAAGVLESLGVELEKTRETVKSLLGH